MSHDGQGHDQDPRMMDLNVVVFKYCASNKSLTFEWVDGG